MALSRSTPMSKATWSRAHWDAHKWKVMLGRRPRRSRASGPTGHSEGVRPSGHRSSSQCREIVAILEDDRFDPTNVALVDEVVLFDLSPTRLRVRNEDELPGARNDGLRTLPPQPSRTRAVDDVHFRAASADNELLRDFEREPSRDYQPLPNRERCRETPVHDVWRHRMVSEGRVQFNPEYTALDPWPNLARRL